MTIKSVDYKYEIRIWAIYFATILISVYIHEIGHCIPAWMHGYWAVPTPAKEYLSPSVPSDLNEYISLGGIIGTVLVSLLVSISYIIKTYRFSSVALAGAIATPGLYTFRFLLVGRGHGDTEFQEAQSVLGLSYSGHSLDWMFLILFVFGVVIWIIKSKPGYRILGRIAIGFVVTIIFAIALQEINNAVFDPIFQTK